MFGEQILTLNQTESNFCPTFHFNWLVSGLQCRCLRLQDKIQMDANVDTCAKKLHASVASISVEGKKSQQDLAV